MILSGFAKFSLLDPVRPISDFGFAHLSSITNLRSLKIYSHRFGALGMQAACKATRLEKLRLTNCVNVPPSSFYGIASLSSLTFLTIVNTPHLPHDLVSFIFAPKLERLGKKQQRKLFGPSLAPSSYNLSAYLSLF